MKIKGVFDLIFSMENLYGALEDASYGRRYHNDVLDFNLHAWEELKRIRDEVYGGTYSIEKYFIFFVYEPKKRIIMSIKFRHRVVQWAIYRVVNPLLVKGYIKDSYGCIPGKGSLKAIERLQYWLKLAEHMGGQWYYLKLDISKYFYRVSHRVLKKLLRKKIKDERLMRLLESIIDCEHTPFGLPEGCGPGDVPMSEWLYDVGMPVGNLMSQVFANVYLDALDQFCKRVLLIRFYIRYMDDIVILLNSKRQLRVWEHQIDAYLETELELNLNNKTCLRPIGQGIEFVGYRVWPGKRMLRKSTTLHIKRAIRMKRIGYEKGTVTMEQAFEVVASYLGMLGHCDSDALREKILGDFVLMRKGRYDVGQHIESEEITVNVAEMVEKQNEVIRTQSDVIDELFRLLMQHTGTEGLNGITAKLWHAVNLRKEIEGELDR